MNSEAAALLVAFTVTVVVCWLIEKELGWRRRRPLADLSVAAKGSIVYAAPLDSDPDDPGRWEPIGWLTDDPPEDPTPDA